MTVLPQALQKGDTIGIVAPSNPFTPDRRAELDNFIEYMKTQEIQVITAKNLFETTDPNIDSVPATKRAEDINSMFANPNIKAIWCLHGGNPANQILDLIDYETVEKNPKLFLGKSDIDVLLMALNTMAGLVTFHTCDTKIGRGREMDFDYTKQWFHKRLLEKSKTVEPSENWKCVQPGVATGKVIGCNMSSILKLAGTKYFPDFSDAILFIETYRSNPDRIRSQLTQLRQIGVFEKISGLVIGNNFEFLPNTTAPEEVIKDFLDREDLPILKTNEFGHYQPHMFLPIGGQVKLDATNKKLELVEDFLT